MFIETNPMIFVLLFSFTVLGFMIAINSRGYVRATLSYVLATVLLISGVYVTITSINDARMKQQLEQQRAIEDARKAREDEESAERTRQQQRQALGEYGSFLSKIADAGMQIAQKLKATDLRDESIPLETYFARASQYQQATNSLIKELSTSKIQAVGFTDTHEALVKGLNNALIASKYLSLYFKSENESEESERQKIFASNVNQAFSSFDQAKGLLSQNK